MHLPPLEHAAIQRDDASYQHQKDYALTPHLQTYNPLISCGECGGCKSSDALHLSSPYFHAPSAMPSLIPLHRLHA
jgi:hypothetical protein